MLETRHPDCLLASALGLHQPCKKLSLAYSKLGLLKAQQVPIVDPKEVQQGPFIPPG